MASQPEPVVPLDRVLAILKREAACWPPYGGGGCARTAIEQAMVEIERLNIKPAQRRMASLVKTKVTK